MAARLGENALFYLFTVFVLEYGQDTLNLGRTELLIAVSPSVRARATRARRSATSSVLRWAAGSRRSSRRPCSRSGPAGRSTSPCTWPSAA
ncbi:MAG: hypothetical protein WKF31_10365 [Thermoleophilaceae bacterium]